MRSEEKDRRREKRESVYGGSGFEEESRYFFCDRWT